MYYVYELADPRTKKVFYVGKGKNARIDDHEYEARQGRQSAKCEVIRSIEANGLSVIKRKVETFHDEQEAYDFEAALICQYGIDNLTNIAPGGGTARGAPTVYADRVAVAVAAEGINRTKNGAISGILVCGKYLDLLPFLAANKGRAEEAIARRGIEWANKIAARFGVSFSYG